MRRVFPTLVCGSLFVLTACAAGADGSGVPLPPAPMGVTAVAGSSTSVHVMWNRLSGKPEVTAYEVYRGTTKVDRVPGGEHMVDVTRLAPSTTYAFTVRAVDSEGNPGPPSAVVRATTPAAVAADRTPPSRPGRPSGKAVGSRAAQLEWSPSTDARGVASYDIYQGGSKIHSVGGAQTATVVTGLRPGTDYSFTVRARDAADNVSPASTAVRLATEPGAGDGRGTAPTEFGVGAHRKDGAYYLDLSWLPPRTDGVITEYRIDLDGHQATSLVWGGTPPRGRSTYSFYVGRDAGVAYRVRLRAKLPDGTWGGFSVERSVTTGETGGG